MKGKITKASLRSQLEELKQAKLKEIDDAALAGIEKIKQNWLNENSELARWYKDFWRYANNLEKAGFNFNNRSEKALWAAWTECNPIVPKNYWVEKRSLEHKVYEEFKLLERIVWQHPARLAFEYLTAKGVPLKAEYEMKPPAVIDNIDLNLILPSKADSK